MGWGDDGRSVYFCAKSGLYPDPAESILIGSGPPLLGIGSGAGNEIMDDSYAIRLAKTKLRDAYNEGDVDGVLSVFANGYSDMSAGLASFYGAEARGVLKHRLKKLFARYRAQLAVTIISIRVHGPWAFDWGWHQLTLRPKKDGKPITTRTRYLEIWQKDAEERWKIAIFLDNVDVPPHMPPKEVLAEISGRRASVSDRFVRGRSSKIGQVG
jgi:ketosteroid isomerase-like protein